jgi:subtilisin family serine protease
MVGAAGNYYHRIDVASGQDYDNWWSSTTNATSGTYYHRGMSPTCSPSFITVGALDNSTTEKKASFSETGPRVDVYSPGVMIMGAYANKSYQTAPVQDPRDSSYYLNKVSGTSQAAPNVAGIIACVAQARPSMTGAEAKKFITDYSEKSALTTVGTDSYTNTSSLQDGNNRIVQMPFTNSNRGSAIAT